MRLRQDLLDHGGPVAAEPKVHFSFRHLHSLDRVAA